MLRQALVVEDERLVRLVLVEMLEELGYEVVAAPSAASARTLASRLRRIDVLVADAGLATRGSRDGEWLRRRRARLGTVFVSGSPLRALDLPHDRRTAFLAKPFRSAELAAAIESLRTQRARLSLTTVYSVRRDRHTLPTPAGALASNERKDRPREDHPYAGSDHCCGDRLCALPGRRPRLAALLLRQGAAGAAAKTVAPAQIGVGLSRVSD